MEISNVKWRFKYLMKIITLPGTGCLERITEKKHETV